MESIAPDFGAGILSPSHTPLPLAPTKGKKVTGSSTGNSSSTRTVHGTTTTDLGVLLSLLILALYFYGFLQSLYALPEISLQLDPPRFLGAEANLNVAMDVYETVVKQGAGGSAVLQSPQINTHDKGGGGGLDRRDAHIRGRHVAQASSNQNGMIKRTGIKDVQVPLHVWPASIKKEADRFETILHPGDLKTKMTVPQFWSQPLHEHGLMTKELALKIGSCSVPDANGSHQRGEDCPEDDRTIYFAIASYRDFQCRFTVESAFGRAKNPKRIRVGVVDQLVEGDPACDEPIEPCDVNPEQALCKYKDQVDVYQMEADLSVGPVFARHIGHRLYRGEYYYTQSDAHVTYTQNWDSDIISKWKPPTMKWPS
ncbi:glycosyltransferase [Fragilaria crotonensis]|nr:glycosyltransferase [Fragilaria crotonensis]